MILFTVGALSFTTGCASEDCEGTDCAVAGPGPSGPSDDGHNDELCDDICANLIECDGQAILDDTDKPGECLRLCRSGFNDVERACMADLSCGDSFADCLQ